MTGSPRRRRPVVDATEPIACSLTAAQIPGRVEQLESLRARLLHVERTEHGLLLHFPPDAGVTAEVRRFAVDERRCCAFWRFAVTATATELRLRWDGPPAAHDLVDHLHAYFRGTAPLTLLPGLL